MRETESQMTKRFEAKIDLLEQWVHALYEQKLDERLESLEKKLSQLDADRKLLLSRQMLVSDQKNAVDIARKQKDKTKYLFQGMVLNKRALVLEGIKRYAGENKGVSSEQLLKWFPPILQPQYGVIRPLEEVRREKKTARFQMRDEDILHLADGEFVVCSEWNINNIAPVLSVFRDKLGYRIDEYVNGQEKGEK